MRRRADHQRGGPPLQLGERPRYPRDGSITKPPDLRGKIVAVSNLPSTRAEVKTLLESAGLTEDDVTLVDPGFGGFTMFLEGKVDANWGLSNVDL